MRYFEEKTTAYERIHSPLLPLPQEAKEQALAFWQRFLPKHRLEHTLRWHTITYNVNRFCPTHPLYLDNAFYYLCILPFLNEKGYSHALADKNYADVLFHAFNKPKAIAKRIIHHGAHHYHLELHTHKPISYEELLHIIASNIPCVIKPTRTTHTGSGNNITLITTDNITEIQNILARYQSDFIIQEKISQHPYLALLNPISINTFRIVSLLWRGHFSILQATLLVGEDGLTANGGHFRIGINLDSHTLRPFIIKGKGQATASLPRCQALPTESIPHFSHLLDMAREMHMLVPHFSLIGWDFSIDSSGNPIFIELNPDVPGCEIMELCNEPLFKNYEEIIALAAQKTNHY